MYYLKETVLNWPTVVKGKLSPEVRSLLSVGAGRAPSRLLWPTVTTHDRCHDRPHLTPFWQLSPWTPACQIQNMFKQFTYTLFSQQPWDTPAHLWSTPGVLFLLNCWCKDLNLRLTPQCLSWLWCLRSVSSRSLHMAQIEVKWRLYTYLGFLSETETGNMDWIATGWSQPCSACSAKLRRRQVSGQLAHSTFPRPRSHWGEGSTHATTLWHQTYTHTAIFTGAITPRTGYHNTMRRNAATTLLSLNSRTRPWSDCCFGISGVPVKTENDIYALTATSKGSFPLHILPTSRSCKAGLGGRWVRSKQLPLAQHKPGASSANIRTQQKAAHFRLYFVFVWDLIWHAEKHVWYMLQTTQ